MANNLEFLNKEHKDFYVMNSDQGDSYKKSLVYLVGLTEDTRSHYSDILTNEGINRAIFNEGWLTGETTRLLILAFNLWNGFTFGYSDSRNDEKDLEDMTKEELAEIIRSGSRNSVDELFSGELGYYYLQAVNLRFNLDKNEESRKQFAAMIEKTIK